MRKKEFLSLMGQAFGAEGHDKGKLSEKASKKDIHPGSTPTYNHHIYKKKKHWAIYKDYFDDSYHSPRKFPSSSFLFSKDRDLHSFIHSFIHESVLKHHSSSQVCH